MIGVPFSIMAYRHPQQFADMFVGVAEAKWGSYFWMSITVVLFLLFVSSHAFGRSERRIREEYVRELEEEIARYRNAPEKGGRK